MSLNRVCAVYTRSPGACFGFAERRAGARMRPLCVRPCAARRLWLPPPAAQSARRVRRPRAPAVWAHAVRQQRHEHHPVSAPVCGGGGACVCACRVLSVRCAPTAQASSSERACACICAHASVRGARALLKRLIATGPHARAPKTLTPTPTFPAPPLPGSSTRLCVCSTPAPRAVRLTPPASAAPSRSARERPPNCWPAYLLGLSEPAECVPARWRRARARASARC